MIYSMTGFGSASGNVGNKQVLVEVKSVNGKQFEITSRINPMLKAYEIELRNQLQSLLKRGSIDISVNIKQDGSSKNMQVNTSIAKSYYNTIAQIANELTIDIHNEKAYLLATIMRMPEVIAPDNDSLLESDWLQIKPLIEQAAQDLINHRKDEGLMLEKDLLSRTSNILALLEGVEQQDPLRIEKIKSRISESLKQITDKVDENRFEQELIYFIEKIDVTEEKQRLKIHCNYFDKIIKESADEPIGKKIGFVLQEIGREINTLGSKANDSTIQQIVVNMKDELEKAKEQSLNVL